MKKKVVAFVLTAVLGASALSACGKDAWDGESEKPDSQEEEQEVTEPETEEEGESEGEASETTEEEEVEVDAEQEELVIPENTGETIFVDFGETISASNCDLTLISYEFYDQEEYTTKPSQAGEDWNGDSYKYDSYKYNGNETYMLDVFFSVSFKGKPEDKHYWLTDCFQTKQIMYQNKYLIPVGSSERIETDDHSDYGSESDCTEEGKTYYYHWPIKLSTRIDKNSGSLVLNFKELDNGQMYAITLFDNPIQEAEERTVTAEPGTINKGQQYSTEYLDFTIEKSQFINEIYAANANDASFFTTYYKADEGKIYIDVEVLIDSFLEESTNISKAMHPLIKVGDWECDTYFLGENKSREDMQQEFSFIPLDSYICHFVAEVPESTKWSEDRVTLEFEIDGNKYTYYVRW